MPDETPVGELPAPGFRLNPTLILVGSAALSGIAAGLIKLVIF